MRETENGRDGQQRQHPYLVGAAGREKIKQLMSLGKPRQAILEFSSDNGLEIPAAQTIYRLLDSLDHTRWSIHNSVLEATVLAAQAQIQNSSMTMEERARLLNSIKSYLTIRNLQHLPLMLIAKHPTLITPDIRDMIRSDPDLYNSCAIKIKQELWRHDEMLFRQSMLPLILDYINNEQLVDMSREISGNRARESARDHRNNSAFNEIALAVDGDIRLYMLTLGIIREELVKTNSPSLGVLRMDLVSAMYNSNAVDIIRDDICSPVARLLDLSVVKQVMDETRVQEIRDYFDGIDSDVVPFGEIALIFSSPYTRHLLARYILSTLEEIAPNAEVSTRYDDLKLPGTIITIGLSAFATIKDDLQKFPSLDRRISREFYRTMIEFIRASQRRDQSVGVHDQHQSGNGRSRPHRAGSFSVSAAALASVSEESGLCPMAGDIAILSELELARQVLYAYLLKRVASLDLGMLNVWLPELGRMVPVFLGISREINSDADTGSDSLSAPPVALNLRVFAFEVDAFVQSLVTHVIETKGMATVILNSLPSDIDFDSDSDGKQGCINKIQTPLVQFLNQLARIRHCAHEQVIRFLAHCTAVVAAEFSLGSGPGTGFALANKESVICFIHAYTEYAAAHFVVDPPYINSLKHHYRELSQASFEQAFKYRVCQTNCPNASQFLK
ncbi:hypothetical protein LPJ57_003362 [Coemansia sp. RSA 486]|nr:hypothetical protein LPJ57_003362 [Coemansia sp. RSA 486]